VAIFDPKETPMLLLDFSRNGHSDPSACACYVVCAHFSTWLFLQIAGMTDMQMKKCCDLFTQRFYGVVSSNV